MVVGRCGAFVDCCCRAIVSSCCRTVVDGSCRAVADTCWGTNVDASWGAVVTGYWTAVLTCIGEFLAVETGSTHKSSTEYRLVSLSEQLSSDEGCSWFIQTIPAADKPLSIAERHITEPRLGKASAHHHFTPPLLVHNLLGTDLCWRHIITSISQCCFTTSLALTCADVPSALHSVTVASQPPWHWPVLTSHQHFTQPLLLHNLIGTDLCWRHIITSLSHCCFTTSLALTCADVTPKSDPYAYECQMFDYIWQ